MEWLIDDVERLIYCLPGGRRLKGVSEEEDDDRTWLTSRLEDVKDKLSRLRAHKFRTQYFARWKVLQQNRVLDDPSVAYEIDDYWGKLAPQKAKQAVGEGMQSGISVHGACVFMRNPPTSIREAHSDVDWSLWPPAPGDGDGDAADLVVVNFRAISDDSRQTPWSVRAVKEAQYATMAKEAPWIKGILSQSDQCADYHSTQALVAFSQLGGADRGRKRVIQRRFNVSVPRARVPEKASTLRERSER